jgi:hypothetical protein
MPDRPATDPQGPDGVQDVESAAREAARRGDVVPDRSAVCPYCGFSADDTPTEIAHMTTWHPEIVAERLAKVGEHVTAESIRATAGPPVPERPSTERPPVIHRVIAHIFVDTDDPEATASSLNDGLETAISHFPGPGEIVGAEVDRIAPASEGDVERFSE